MNNYLKHISFYIETNNIFKSNDEFIKWIKDHNTIEIKDIYNNEALYENFNIVSTSDNKLNITFDTCYPDISDEEIKLEVKYLVENIDDDGNYPVCGQLINLTMIPNSLVISQIVTC